jgi:hypothetical protein
VEDRSGEVNAFDAETSPPVPARRVFPWLLSNWFNPVATRGCDVPWPSLNPHGVNVMSPLFVRFLHGLGTNLNGVFTSVNTSLK